MAALIGRFHFVGGHCIREIQEAEFIHIVASAFLYLENRGSSPRPELILECSANLNKPCHWTSTQMRDVAF